MSLLGLKRRSRVWGLPIGPKRVDWTKVALLGLGAFVVVAASATTARRRSDAMSSLVSVGRDALESATVTVASVWREVAERLWPDVQDGPPRDEQGRFVAPDDEAEGGLREEGEARERA